MDGLTEGRIVHYVLHEGRRGEHRPAIVVKVWRVPAPVDARADSYPPQEPKQVPPENGCCNLQVFTDSWNDGLKPVIFPSSVLYSETHEPGTWHWIEKA